jgi:hypothetical protein
MKQHLPIVELFTINGIQKKRERTNNAIHAL